MAKKSKSGKKGQEAKGSKVITYKQGRPTRVPRGSVGASRSQKPFDLAHAMVNPFSPRARGAKIPDDDSSRSVAITNVTRINHTIQSGQTVAYIQANLQDAWKRSGTLTGSTVTAWNGSYTSVTDFAALNSSFSSYRIVSWGVRVIPLAAPTNQSGSIAAITLSSNPTGANYDTASTFVEEIEMVPVAGADLHWVAKPQGTEWKSYIPMTSTHNWTSVVFAFYGYPSAQEVLFELFYNLECQVAVGQISGGIASPAADHNPHALALADHTRNRLKQAHPSSGSLLSSIGSAMTQGLAALADMALPAAGRMVMRALTPAPSYPRIIDVD